MGMNHPGEIAQLAAIARPTVALVNNAQREHQEFMHSVAAVAEENGGVLSALGPDGVAVFPADDPHTPVWRRLAGARRTWCFGWDASAEVWPQHSRWLADHWEIQLHTPVGVVGTELHIAGRHNLRNAMAATATALAAGAPVAAVAEGLRAFRPVAGRSRTHALQWQGHTCTVVDDSYNANPDSVLAAIDVLADLPAPRLLVLGDMGEVGVNGAAFHAEVGQHAQAQGIERLFTLGDLARASAAAHAQATHFGDMAALQAAVLAQAAEGGSVLVKGSRFMRMERVVQALREHASDQEATCS
jgi:UDP-N-acetylmuramoyl-tripeptide--D-alanyl-D-alanine ligase